MAAQQQQQHIQINGQQLGLTRSRHTLGNAQEPEAKRHNAGTRSWAHAAATQVKDGGGKIVAHICSHGCLKDTLSSNVTRLKKHLLGCPAFLRSDKARQLAETEAELRAVINAGCGGDPHSASAAGHAWQPLSC